MDFNLVYLRSYCVFMCRITFFLLVCLIATSLSSQQTKTMKHIFYLHGMILESQGINAVSTVFGPYKYQEIIDSLKATGYQEHSEVRTTKTNFNTFCTKVSGQIDELVKEGIQPNDISVIGASKGALMAMTISDRNTHAINYILLGANSDRTEQNFEWKLHGRILGIYEKSDNIAGKAYSYWIDRSTGAKEFMQLEINTGLGHGFLYRPIKEWLNPTLSWVRGTR
jgi:hypothetical protein